MFSRKRLRLFAAHVLLAWVFALATSIVHACIVEPAARGAAPAAAHETSALAHDHAPALHVTDEAPPGTSHPHEAACEKFCDEPSTAAQAPKPPIDPTPGGWVLPPPLVAYLVEPANDVARMPAPDPERRRPGSPVAIVFLRLAL